MSLKTIRERVANPHWRAEEPEGTTAEALNSMKPMHRGGLPDDATPDVLEEMEMARGMGILMDDGGEAE